MMEQAREQAEAGQQTTRKLKERAQEWTEKAKSSARDAGATADLYVHEYAWTSLLLLTATAGILGFLLGRSRRD